MLGKSFSNFFRVSGLSGGTISRAGGWTFGHSTGGGECVAQPATKVATTSIGSRQLLTKTTLYLLVFFVLPRLRLSGRFLYTGDI